MIARFCKFEITMDNTTLLLTSANTSQVPPDAIGGLNQTPCIIYDFIVEGVIMGFLCFFGFCGNALSMICLTRDKSKTATPFLLASLEAADTLFLVTVLILRVLNSISMYFDAYYNEPLWAYVGKYVYAFAMISETGTVYITLLVTLNRYVSVCRPHEALQMCSVTHARQHVLFVIAFSVIFNVSRFFEYDFESTVDEHGVTVIYLGESKLAENTVYQIVYKNVAYFLIMFLIPLIMLIILNYKLILALRETKRRRAQLHCTQQSRSEDDITLMLIVVVLVFIVCQTPALFTQVLGNTLSTEQTLCPAPFFYHARISDLLVVGNSSLNFIVYCFCSKKFREILKSLVCTSRHTSLAPTAGGARTNRAEVKTNSKYTAVPNEILPLENGNGICEGRTPQGTPVQHSDDAL